MAITDDSLAEAVYGHASTLKDDHPEKVGIMDEIGWIFWERYQLEHRTRDLDKAIIGYDTSIRLASNLDPGQAQRLANLSAALITRFQDVGNISDLNRACDCIQRSIAIRGTGPVEPEIMTNLGVALLLRFERLRDLSDLDASIAAMR